MQYNWLIWCLFVIITSWFLFTPCVISYMRNTTPKFLKHRAHIMYALLQNVKLCAADVASFQIIFPYKFNYTFSSLYEKSLSNLNRCLNMNSSKVEEKLLFVQWTTRNCTFAPVPREISIKINLLLSQSGRTTTQKASLKNVLVTKLDF